jgi:ribosomal protein S18 acetylase RimI-like enzyme|tara:strand:+ start:611 stop:1147 length:537 start_codon:yes stop_codon:yes gene_type:complete
MTANLKEKITIKVEALKIITDTDLADLCNITEQAIKAGGGFGWLKTPPREVLNKYWKGLVVVQNRILIVGRLNGAIAGTLQLNLKPSNNEAQKTIININSHFVAPWARGYGLAKNMIDYAEISSKQNEANCIQLDIRETQEAAIQLFKSKGYIQWGENPNYANVEGETIKGLYFYKNI